MMPLYGYDSNMKKSREDGKAELEATQEMMKQVKTSLKVIYPT